MQCLLLLMHYHFDFRAYANVNAVDFKVNSSAGEANHCCTHVVRN